MATRKSPNNSDECNSSIASTIAPDALVSQHFVKAAELELLPGSTILERSLNIKSVISTTSSFGRRFQSAKTRPDLQDINQIGIGLQGVILEQIGKSFVLKKELPGNESRHSNLRHEYVLHRAVWAAFERYRNLLNSEISIPKAFEFLPRTRENSFWNEILPKIPREYRMRSDVVKMERILPLPKVIRRAFITQFCGATDPENLLNAPQNKHCLARVYLGRSQGPINDICALRNFPLYLNSMNTIRLNTATLAAAIGKAYAIMHWGSGVDGDDVEFVLGTSVVKLHGENLDTVDFQHRAIGLFLLDFGNCQEVDLTQSAETVYQAFKGAMVSGTNADFIPRPTSPELFAAFKEGYIEAGKWILSDRRLQNIFNVENFFQEYEAYTEEFLY